MRHTFSGKYSLFITCCITALAYSTPLFAQDNSTSFQFDDFEPQANQRENILNTATSDVTPHLKLGAGIFAHYLDKPISGVAFNGYFIRHPELKGKVKERELLPPYYVYYQFKAEAGLTLGLFDVVELGVSLPVGYQELSQSSANGFPEVQDPYPSIKDLPGENTFVIQDLRFSVKGQLIDPKASWAHGFGLALQLTGYFPIPIPGLENAEGTRFNQWNSYWTSTDQPGGYLEGIRGESRLILDWRHLTTGIKIAANVAYLYQPKRDFARFVFDQELRWNAAIELPIPFVDWIRPMATFYGNIPLSLFTENDKHFIPVQQKEWEAGIKFIMPHNLVGQIGGGGPLYLKEIGVPMFRAFASFGYYPTASTEDTDGDGILDDADQCPEQAGPQENRGCPWGDRDNDGIMDNVDKCPEDPEDVDEFEDEDGCPDIDNDNDGIPDDKDQCPNDAEDKDGFQDEDGCPDLDNDNDGIPDTTDKCPDAAEVINGNNDEDGCPDDGTSKLRITETKIEILGKVHFNTGKAKIRTRSFDVLNQVAAALRNIKKITKLRIEGHTDSRGRARSNMKLSQARAEAVRDFLIEKGSIDPQRLIATGYGEEQPIASNGTADGREANRRVEFTIVEVDGKPVSTGSVTVQQPAAENK